MEDILIVGTGPMAVAYAEVLKAMKKSFMVVGRGELSAKHFEEIIGIKPIIGGLSSFLEHNKIKPNCYVIIAVGTEELMPSLLSLIGAGVNRILIEKPAAISIKELLENELRLSPFLDSIFIAYNRRFYGSVIETQRLIEEDGGLKSMHFEFTEWSHKIGPLHKAPGVKENWFFANSTHVVDLAFSLAGKPKEWQSYSKSGNLKWHEKTNFAGAGITDGGVLFSYISNWESAGRWGIELLTDKRRIYLKPMEKISIQQKGSIALSEHAFDDSLDIEFKPGLFLQVDSFLNKNNTQVLCNLGSHIYNTKHIYSKIISTSDSK
jgi:predicted dehydrogenase